MSSIEQPSSIERNARKRATSRQPAWPSTRCVGKPEAFHAVYTIASSGFERTMITESGACFATFSATLDTMPMLVTIRSSRLMPGLRGMPAVMTTMSLPSISA